MLWLPMVSHILSPVLNSLFWMSLLVVVTGGFDIQTTVAGQDVRLDLTSPDLLVLLFLLLAYAWHRSGRAFLDLACIRSLAKAYEWIEARGSRVVFAAIGVATLVYLLIPLVRHHSFQTGIDLALFGQAYWNTVQGDFLVSSIQGDMTLWGEHFNPIVLAILPLYRLWPSPETLLVLQSLALVAGALPLYALARRELPHPGLAPFLTLAYLLYLPLRLTNLFDFHPIVFATPMILAAFYFLRSGKYSWFLLFCLMTGATKETGPIAVGLLGAACLFMNRKRWLGGAIIVASVVWFLVSLFVVMPLFNPAGVATQLDRYGYLGDSIGEILLTLATRPFYVLSENLSSRELMYPVRILAPVAFLPLLTPVGLLAVPYLAINLLEWSGIQVWLVHYQAELTAFVFIAAVFGARRLLAFRSSRYLAATLAAGTFLFFGQSDIYRLREAWPTEETRRIHRAVARVPSDGGVAAQAAIAPHLTQRNGLFIFPDTSWADWVIVDFSLDPWPVRPHRFNRTVKRLRRESFEIVFEEGPTRIYRRYDPTIRPKKRNSDRPRRQRTKRAGGDKPRP